MYVIDTATGALVPYDDTFKSYATIKYSQSQTGSTGEFSPCSISSEFTNLIDLPTGSSISNVYCPSINLAE